MQKFQNNKSYLIILISFLLNSVFAQQKQIDSLKIALKTAKHDTIRCAILYQLAETAPEGEWEKFNEQLKILAETKLKITKPSQTEFHIYKKHYAASLNNVGLIYSYQNNIPKALEYYSKSQKIQEEIGDKKGVATTLNNIGLINNDQGNITKALEYHGKSLKIMEEISDNGGIARSLNNIADIYGRQGNITKALEYYTKSLNILQEIGNKEELGILLNNIGVIYQDQLNIPKALEYYFKSLKIHEDIFDKKGIATVLYNIGLVYKIQDDFIKAFNYFDKSLKIQEEIGNKRGITNSLTSIGEIYLKQKNYSKALTYCSKSMRIAEELAFPENIRNTANQLSFIYKAKNDYKNALVNYELFIKMRDSISNQETKKASIKNQLKYEYDKKALADSIQLADTKKLNKTQLAESVAKLKQQKIQRFALLAGLALVLGFLAYTYKRYRFSNKQKLLIEEQKKVVDQSQKKILDSINYAKKIQNSLLPNSIILQNYFSDLFLLYKPKDIVSGDFYWLHETPSQILFALGDATGHGVPGALTSILCQNSLDAACRELTDLQPNKILKNADTYLKQKTSKQINANVDGMAVSLIGYNKTSKILKFSSANQCIYILRNNEVIELKSTTFSVGSLNAAIELKEENMQLQTNDMIYFISDGFPDQKGGPLKRRLTTGNVKKMLLSNAQKPCNVQKDNLNTEFEVWRQKFEQIDDVSVLGFRV